MPNRILPVVVALVLAPVLAVPALAQTAEPTPLEQPGPPPEEQPPSEDTEDTEAVSPGPILDEIVAVPPEVLPTDEGPASLGSYDIGFNPDGVNAITPFDGVFGGLTALVFTGVTWTVAFVIWLLDWVFSFGIGRELGPTAAQLGSALDQRLVGKLNLAQTGVLVAVAWAGWHAVRGRAARGLGELGVSLLLAVVAATAFQQPTATICAGFDVLARLSGDVLALAAEAGPSSSKEPDPRCLDPGRPGGPSPLQPFARAIANAFVVQPALLLNWGSVPESDCLEYANRAAASGPHGGSDARRLEMDADPACRHHAVFNAEPSAERLAGALLILLATLCVGATTVALALTVAVAQVVGAALIVAGPVALAVGVAPGPGRHLLIRWATGLARVAVAVLASALLLSLLTLLASAVLTVESTDGLFGRCLLLCVVCGGLFVGRRRLILASHRFAIARGQHLERASGGVQWLGYADADGDTGFGLHRLGHPGYTDVDALRPREAVHATFTRNRIAEYKAAVAFVADKGVDVGIAVATGGASAVGTGLASRVGRSR